VADAERALVEGDNKMLDANHTLKLSLYDDFDKYINMNGQYIQPPKVIPPHRDPPQLIRPFPPSSE
jgi:hypothetical protein